MILNSSGCQYAVAFEMLYQIVSLCFLYVLWRLWSKNPSGERPPELSGKLPLIGHAYKLIGDGVKVYKFNEEFSKECLEKGGLMTVNLGPRKVYGVVDPEDSLTILNECLQKNYIYEFMKPYFGNGIVTADAITWKKNRKLLNPAFNQNVLNSFIGIFNSQALSLVDRFATEVGKPFGHGELLRINNLETICTTSLGIDPSKYSELQKQYLPRTINLLKLVTERIQRFWLHSDFIYNMTQRKKIQDENLEKVLGLSKSIIKEKKAERESTVKQRGKSNGKFKPFIDLILDLAEENENFTDEHIRAEVDGNIGAGHDTTAALLTFALTILGSRTDVQEKAYKEVLNVLGNEHKLIDQDDLSKLVYIDAVLKETLRLYPVIPLLGRRIQKDLKLKNYKIPANSDSFCFLHGLHRHSIWGPDADQFRPERWLDKGSLPDLKYFGGFGLGRRFCIGKSYAMMSMKITLAHVLRNYRISSDGVSKMLVTMEIVLRAETGHYITLLHREA